MLDHSTLNHTHVSSPQSQPDVTVDYGEAIGKSVVVSIVFYLNLVLPHDTISKKKKKKK